MTQKYSRKHKPRTSKPDICQLYCFNKGVVSRLRESLPEAGTLVQAENFFAALGNRTRLLVLYCLSQAEELCVCDIANALEMNLSTVSHQLRYLRAAGFVMYRSEGKMAFYRLTDRRITELIDAELCAKLEKQ